MTLADPRPGHWQGIRRDLARLSGYTARICDWIMGRDITQRPGSPAWSWPHRLVDGVRATAQRLAVAISRDWAGSRLYSYGAAVGLLTCVIVAMYLINNPAPYLPYHDSYEYIASAHRIMAGGSWADPQRLPGYPLFLAIIFTLAGKTTLRGAEVVQLALFVVTTLEVYAISYHIWRTARLAAVIAILVGSNVYFLEFVKPILSDGLALWLVTTLALAVVSFVEQPRPARFWLVASLTLVLFMTRAEWYLAPIPLFAYLLYVAHRRGLARRLVPHALLAATLLYAVMVGYILLNAHVNGVAQLTADERINLYGKVTQYNMQGEATPQFADIANLTEYDMSVRHIHDPWAIYWHNPQLGHNHFQEMGAYARSIIEHHPLEFLGKSAPLAITSLDNYYQFARINTQRRLAKPLMTLLSFSSIAYDLAMLFPLCAAWWLIVLFFRRHTRNRQRAELMGAVVLLALYDLAVTTLGSYGEYARLHLAFDPLLLIVVVGTLVGFATGRRQARLPKMDTRDRGTAGRPTDQPSHLSRLAPASHDSAA